MFADLARADWLGPPTPNIDPRLVAWLRGDTTAVFRGARARVRPTGRACRRAQSGAAARRRGSVTSGFPVGRRHPRWASLPPRLGAGATSSLRNPRPPQGGRGSRRRGRSLGSLPPGAGARGVAGAAARTTVLHRRSALARDDRPSPTGTRPRRGGPRHGRSVGRRGRHARACRSFATRARRGRVARRRCRDCPLCRPAAARDHHHGDDVPRLGRARPCRHRVGSSLHRVGAGRGAVRSDAAAVEPSRARPRPATGAGRNEVGRTDDRDLGTTGHGEVTDSRRHRRRRRRPR